MPRRGTSRRKSRTDSTSDDSSEFVPELASASPSKRRSIWAMLPGDCCRGASANTNFWRAFALFTCLLVAMNFVLMSRSHRSAGQPPAPSSYTSAWKVVESVLNSTTAGGTDFSQVLERHRSDELSRPGIRASLAGFKVEAIAPVLVSPGVCGSIAAQRLNLVYGMMVALLLGGQVILPNDVPMFGAETMNADNPSAYADRTRKLWDVRSLSDEMSLLASTYWCDRKGENQAAWQLWCQREGEAVRRILPTRITSIHLPYVVQEIAASGRGFSEFRLRDKRFDLQTMEKLSSLLHAASADKTNVHIVLDCDHFHFPIEEGKQTWDIFWHIYHALQFESQIQGRIKTLLDSLQTQHPMTLRRADAGAGAGGKRDAFNVLQLRVEGDWVDFCASLEDLRPGALQDCVGSSHTIANTLIAEGLDPSVPLYIANSMSREELRSFKVNGVAAFADLFEIFNVVTKDSVFDGMQARWQVREREKWAAVDFAMAELAQSFVGNGLSHFAGLAMVSRLRMGKTSLSYSKAEVALIERGVFVLRDPLVPSPFSQRLKWVFTVHEGSSGVSRRDAVLIKQAVQTAAERTSLVPVCVTTSGWNSPLTKFLMSNDVRVLFVHPEWTEQIKAKLQQTVDAPQHMSTTIIDRSSDVYLNADLDFFLDKLLPLEIAVSGLLDDFVLYSEIDVQFLKELKWGYVFKAITHELEQTRPEFLKEQIVYVSKAKGLAELSMEPQEGFLQLPRFFAAVSRPHMSMNVDAGVLLINMRTFRETRPTLLDRIVQGPIVSANNLGDAFAAALMDAYVTTQGVADPQQLAIPQWCGLPMTMNARESDALGDAAYILRQPSEGVALGSKERPADPPREEGKKPPAARSPVGGDLRSKHISDIVAPRSPWKIYNEHALEIISHRVDPIGLQFYAPWASGKTLRMLPSKRDPSLKGTLLFYCVSQGDATGLENLQFYLTMLERQLQHLQHTAETSASPVAYKHIFVIPPFLSLKNEDPKLSGYLDKLITTSWRQHSMEVVRLDQRHFMCSNDILRMIDCALGVLSFDHSSYRSVVILDNTMAGPFLPKYWLTAGYEFWADVYTWRLSGSVRLVGPAFTCSTNGQVPVFERPPLAMDQTFFQIMRKQGFKHSVEDVTRLLLATGYNMEALHGQPVGLDWQRWLRQTDPHECPSTLQPLPPGPRQPPCNWKDWKSRYPELAELPLQEAREKFLAYSQPQGECADFCDYGKYMSYYLDLSGRSTIEEAKKHFLQYGSIEGRNCFDDAGMVYQPHVYETLFVKHASYVRSLEADNYMHWEAPMADIIAVGGQDFASTTEERILVVYAYYEKNDEYRENLIHFLDTCIATDALNGYQVPVDYVVVVNGKSTVEFPKLDNLKVIQRENTCFDFGAWGAGLKYRQPEHKYFYCLNSSVRGPYLPAWFKEHWSLAMMALITKHTELVGTTLNCPDGVGRAVPHIMSMAMLFTVDALEKGLKKGVFDCAESYHDALVREGSWSQMLLESGANVDTMQAMYTGHDWTRWYNEHRTKPHGGVQKRPDGYNQCDGIALDVFYKDGWYSGMTPHPIEFVFFKLNRHIGVQNALSIATLREASTFGRAAEMRNRRATQGKVTSSSAPLSAKNGGAKLYIALFSHSLDLDGAPRLLYHMALEMKKRGHELTVLCPTRGALQALYNDAGIPVIIIASSGNFWDALAEGRHGLDDIIRAHFPLQAMPDLLILNTIMWADYLYRRADLRPQSPRVAWMLHEGEITEKRKTPTGYWFGKDFPQIANPSGLRRLTASVDSVVFVSDATRSLWSMADMGNFYTFRGYIPQAATEKRASIFGDSKAIASLRAAIGAKDKFMLTMVGTICQRKQQDVLVKALELVGGEIFGKGGYVLVLVGAPSNAGGKGDMSYVDDLMEYVKSKHLSDSVKFIPFADNTLNYVAAADLHFSASMNEAFPLNTLEAMLLGTPVMMTRAGGSEEQLAHPGPQGDGFLLPLTTDPAVLADNIKSNLEKLDLRKVLPAMGARARMTVLNRFTDDKSDERVADLLEHAMGTKAQTAPQGSVCILVRSYIGQLTDPVYSLQKMLRSLVDLNYKAWTALIVQTDPKEMVGLYGLLSQLNDQRFRVIQYPDLPPYRSGAFEITDAVVPQCPQDSEWLLATNGDNTYEPEFLDHLDLDYDIIAYDFYSRSTHILDPEIQGDGCAKYFEHRDSLCKKNLLKHWHTDLGANVLNLKRWKIEGRSFEALNEEDGSADGHTMESLVYYNWRVKHVSVEGKCLFSHNPNVLSCAEADRAAIWVDEIQECIVDEAEKKKFLANGYHPHYSPHLHPGVDAIQGRCYDNVCPKHEEFVALALNPAQTPVLYFVDSLKLALHPVKDAERAHCHGRNAYRNSRVISSIPPFCGTYAKSSIPFSEKDMCMQSALGV